VLHPAVPGEPDDRPAFRQLDKLHALGPIEAVVDLLGLAQPLRRGQEEAQEDILDVAVASMADCSRSESQLLVSSPAAVSEEAAHHPAGTWLLRSDR
jgi:hypothetical protein